MRPTVVYCGTTNRGKLREFQESAAHFGGFAVEPAPGLANMPLSEENGATFLDNAVQKALHYSRGVEGWLFADDSGLSVDALDGAPGVHSARFAGPEASDEDNNRLLLERMNGAADRRARFICVVALVWDGSLVRSFEGAVEGEILDAPRGTGGFGYDPLFYYEPFRRTLAECTAEQKVRISHRGQALRAMFEYLAGRESGAR